MKLVHVLPTRRAKKSLKALLKAKERELRGRGTAFTRQREGRWVHAKYSGWINWDETFGGVLVAEVNTKKPELEWQLLQAFIGYVDRHLSGNVESILISYR